MAREIEAKIRVASHEPVRRRLGELGAKRLGCVLETNRIFDRSDGSLRNRGCGLRVRTTMPLDGKGTGTTTLTYKGPVQPGAFKSREELEVSVSNADTLAQLLFQLGCVQILQFEKRRESWLLGECRIELDEPPHIGLFVEIEGPDDAAIRAAIDSLGLADEPHVSASYVRMLADYCAEQGICNRVLRLADPPPVSK